MMMTEAARGFALSPSLYLYLMHTYSRMEKVQTQSTLISYPSKTKTKNKKRGGV